MRKILYVIEHATADTLRTLLADLETLDELSVAIIAAATGQTPELVAAWERSSTTFDARSAITAGLAYEFTA